MILRGSNDGSNWRQFHHVPCLQELFKSFIHAGIRVNKAIDDWGWEERIFQTSETLTDTIIHINIFDLTCFI